MRRLLLLLFCLLILTASVSAAGSQIDTLEEEVLVDTDGTLSVTVTVTLSGDETEFVFPLGTGAENITASGGTYQTKVIDGTTCVVFTGGLKDTFVCAYTLPGDVSASGDGQQFRMQPIEKGWEFPIDTLKLQVTFPAEITARPAWSSSYYGDVADNYLNVRILGQTLDVTSAAPLKDHETLELTLQFPADTFTRYATGGSMQTIGLWAFYLLLLAAVLYWALRLRGALLLPGKQQTVGMEATAGELTCQLYGELPDLAATVAHWGNLGYLTVTRSTRGLVLLHKKMEMGNERRAVERRLFDAIFRNSATCDVRSERFRRLTRFAEPIRKTWRRRVYQRGNPGLLRWLGLLVGLIAGLLTFDLWLPAGWSRWVLLPILSLLAVLLCYLIQRSVLTILREGRMLRLLVGIASAAVLMLIASSVGRTGVMLLNLCLQLFCGLTTLFGGKRTRDGEELVRQQLGLRRYLRRADPDALARVMREDGQYFYRTLPFAELLGVGAAFAKHCGSLPEPCPWLTDPRIKTAPEFYQRYREVAAVLRGGKARRTPAGRK